MASNTQRGNQYEGEVKKILERDGWIVEGQHRMIKFIPDWKSPREPGGKTKLKMIMVGRDVFGCDIIAKKPGEKTLFIQVSTHNMKSQKIKQVAPFPWNHDYETLQIWLRTFGTKEFDIYQAPTFELLKTIR